MKVTQGGEGKGKKRREREKRGRWCVSYTEHPEKLACFLCTKSKCVLTFRTDKSQCR